MAILSISKAARTWSVSRSTLHRAIREGRLSVATQPDGSKGIDTAELHRVFGEARSAPERATGDAGAKAVGDTGPSRSNAPAPLQADTALLIDALQAQIALLQSSIEEARERERWLRQQLEDMHRRLLPAPKKPWIDWMAVAWQRLRNKER